MPYIQIRIAGNDISPGTIAVLQADVTALMGSVLRKKQELTAVEVQQVAANGWTIGGRSVTTAAHLEANITAGTNTAAEKAEFIARAAALLKACCGGLDPATYVIIREIPADSWGYDGRTQEQRRVDALSPA